MNLIGVDVGGTKIRAGFVADGALCRVEEVETRSGGAQEEIVAQVLDLIDVFWDRDLAGIGIGVPAIVDVGAGVVYETAQIPSWRQVPLRDLVESRFGVRTWVNNDSNCFAVAESVFGAGRGYRDIAAVTIGSGLGVGLILDAKLYSGHNCGAGELGRIVYRDGRLTEYCSGKFFVREYGVTGTELLAQARTNDTIAQEAFSRFGWHLGKGLSVLAHIVDPQLIVLGGGIAGARDFFWESMLESLEASVYRRSCSRLRLEVSTLRESAVLGAAALCRG